jgi:hypothetical protein
MYSTNSPGLKAARVGSGVAVSGASRVGEGVGEINIIGSRANGSGKLHATLASTNTSTIAIMGFHVLYKKLFFMSHNTASWRRKKLEYILHHPFRSASFYHNYSHVLRLHFELLFIS